MITALITITAAAFVAYYLWDALASAVEVREEES